MKKVNLSEDTDKECLENRVIEHCLNKIEHCLQRVCDQAMDCKIDGSKNKWKNGWLSQIELETIKRQVEDKFQGQFSEDDAMEVETVESGDTAGNEDMVDNEVESVAEEIVNVEEVNNNVIDSVDDTRHNLNDEHRKIVERLNEILLDGKPSDGIMFRQVDKKYFKSKKITETNDLIKSASVWVAEQIGLKKRNYREKTNLDGNAELKEI